MGTTDCRRHGFILVLVLFLTSISCLASKMDFSSKLGNQIPVCRHQNRSRAPVLMFDCKEKGYVFSKINFADYGHSSGDCGNFRRGNCGAPDTLRLVKKVRKINQH
ncbi:hypothetical protein ISN45_At03g045770 [Arabidopsis thaliana x Arabidopsis arenosa]|uniref:Uncharacterized protein n=2 Tax=Arabidopsis TaxID=3701 RepID=A0A8T2FSC7_ARASU|nr:hypothetical protein ISN45_At03g045770 [Arabidopsis thaliana x Arabidopsis arenosa]KAG7634221.1 hypothetical protein ISN44_As03g044720 [Arabidopsis suecica]